MENNSTFFKIENRPQKPFWFLTDRKVRAVAMTVLAFALIAGVFVFAPDKSMFTDYIGIFIIFIIVGVALFFGHKKPYDEFIISNQGIVITDRTYLWDQFSDFHWFGESQSERFGLINIQFFDPINPYAGDATQIAKLSLKKNRFNIFADYLGYLSLEIDRDRMDEFSNLLQQHGINKIPFAKQLIGSWRSAVLLLIFLSIILLIIFIPSLFSPLT